MPVIEHRRRQELRVSDAERELAADALRGHFAAGRLTADELELRVARVYVARTRADLARLMADLPSDRGWRALRRLYGWQRAALPYHAAACVSVSATLIGVWSLTGEGEFWPAWIVAPGTLILGWHAAGSRLLRRSLGLPTRPLRPGRDRA